jgi:flagellin-like protein
MNRRPLNDKGVSVIIGTLLLILITVTAAAALALMISQMQKEETNRQTQITAVKDEDIAISGMNLANNEALWNSAPFNISNSQNWSSVSFNLMNLNTKSVGIIGIAINNQYATAVNFTSLPLSFPMGYCSFSEGNELCIYNNTGMTLDPNLNMSSLEIPAGQSEKITINLTDYAQPIGTNNQIDIKIITSLTNVFEQTYKLPTPVISYNTETTTLGSVQKDSIMLDGSQSSSENATIVGWNWTLMNATNTWPTRGVCSDINNLSTISVPPYFNSKIVHFSPPVNGPFCANLTITDSNGMVATTAQDQLIPADTQFTPAANLIATFNTTYSPPVINVTILDINGNPVNNAAVNYVVDVNQFGNLTLSNYVGTTNSQGMSSTNVTCGVGTVKVVSGQIPSSEVAVNANSGC